jgi:hypothetical protein
MPPPCQHGPAQPESCHLCWLYLHRADYRALWDRQVVPLPASPRRAACRHRGGGLRQEVCPSCRGHVRLKVLACALHGECTVGRPLPGLACCATCPDYDPGETPEWRPPPGEHQAAP